MVHELTRPADVVADDRVGLYAGHRAVDEHERNAELRDAPQVRPRAVADRGDRHPLDTVGDHLLDHLALDLEVGARVAEDHAVARRAGQRPRHRGR